MKTIQVFEHQVIQVGEILNGVTFELTHFQALVKLAPTPYFQLQHQSVRFSHYVGMIQLPDLALEVLPKAGARHNAAYWKTFLVTLLQYCERLNLDSNEYQINSQSHTVLELYLASFLQAVEGLLYRGLATEYITVEGNQKAFSGKLLMAKHLQHNLVHYERFFVRKRIKTYYTLLNQIIFYALRLVQQLYIHTTLKTKLNFCLAAFSSFVARKITIQDLDKIQLNTTNAYYKPVLEYARQIIEQQWDDIFSGKFIGTAWMYDMNLLFEEYLYRQLQAACPTSVKIFKQQRQDFWQGRFIRPDIVIQTPQQTIVLDTKWKMLERLAPAMSDIQQAFVYNYYFNAQKTVLIFPKAYTVEDLPPTPFQPTADGKTYFCAIQFVEVVREKGLNLALGKELLPKLMDSPPIES